MKKLITISSILLLTGNFIFAQNKDSLIKAIRIQYGQIRENYNSYDTTMIDIWDESTEGGQATGFYDNGEPKLIEVVLLGETGKKRCEYYFNSGKLIFAYNQGFHYNRPIYWDEKTAKENEDDEFFDPNKTTVTEDRYYFDQEKLILWLDNDKKEVDLTDQANLMEGQDLITHGYEMKAKLKR